MKQGHEKLTNLQAARAVAALAVVACHLSTSLPAFAQAMPDAVANVALHGFLGVDFFFVLSGFIIAHVHLDDAPGSGPAKDYLIRRLLRIYVPYLPIAVGLALLFTLAPRLAGDGRNWGWLTTLTLLPSSSPSVISIAWTLVHELAFYGIFALSYFAGRAFRWIMLAWVAVIIGLWVAGYRWPEYGNDWPEVFFAPINLEFVGGMLAALACRRLSTSLWPLFGLAAVVLVTGCFLLGVNRVLFGGGMGALVVAIVLAERAGWRSPGWLSSLGDASYSMYLLHLTVFSVTMRLTAPLGSWVVGSAFAVASVIAVSMAYTYIYELRFIRWSRSRLLPRTV